MAHSTFNRNEYQGNWRIRLTTSLPSVSRLGNVGASRPPQPDTGIALLYLFYIHGNVSTLYTMTQKTVAVCTSKRATVLTSTRYKDQRAGHHKVNHTESLKLMIIPVFKMVRGGVKVKLNC
jgi:hypothetical protein